MKDKIKVESNWLWTKIRRNKKWEMKLQRNDSLSNNCSWRYDVKILSFRLCDEQVEFARPYIKN